MKQTINNVKVEGKIYGSTLEAKVSKEGKEYINGELQIQVSETNVVPVGFFESKTTSTGKANQKYQTLLGLIQTMKTVESGAEEPTIVSITNSSLRLREYTVDGVPKVSYKDAAQQGGFVNVIPATRMNPMATFKNDVMITSVVREIDPQTNQEKDYLTINAFIFDYKNAITPMTFVIYNPRGIEYFSTLSPNTFTQIWGNIESNTIKTQRITQNAFGEDLVEETVRTTKQWVVTGANTVPFGEDQMTVQEWQKCLADRQLYIAELVKKEQERAVAKASGGINTNPMNQMGANPFAGMAAPADNGGFLF